MTSMFPSPYRPSRGEKARERQNVRPPIALYATYYLAIIIAIALIVSALVLFSVRAPQGVSTELAQIVARNHRFLAVVNLLGGLCLAGLAGKFFSSAKNVRRFYLAICVFLVAFNLIAIMLKIGGIGLMIIVFAIIVDAMLYFHPSVSSYFEMRKARK
ncbi:hypothetical protein EML15_09220 [Corynebacterium sp. sy017]|uniref:hypothetical protein n=1 Tax=unclassified Corynebacterium TaxID=2624378 RepID=UPI0011872B5B|nr:MULTISPECIES: hypothetical protein [unclassified Corynebacterium]MBP3089319.1 hypothetical protein [Corynebacterium sp. sy017]QDZ43256.1 hypothetical protein FQV43_08905 [Corynebacterium sp. sy039]TSD90981.1 hypothetical protein ELY17_09380 [Corynebacterium sp. SY003]